ncbi:hypothetical protein D0T49_09880 [Paludibacter sp. 221]|uniref:flotillin-like FloA family protein n=1 Tax=Paludibacter sp. 221 TaxID=2302939 RepID=UPI0013D022B4|nr:flotillin-like FloA family protein [Paludibacter sp. 221]NDV47353.1 hypothetical protein [Paludibacter sp. 221]
METSIIIGIVLLAIFTLLLFYYIPFIPWITAKVASVHIPLSQLFLIRIRKIPPNEMVMCMIEIHKAELKDIHMNDLQAHYLAGGNVQNVIHALITAKCANINLTFRLAAAIDLAGKNILEGVIKLRKKKEEGKEIDINTLLLDC